jgi:hypothetical protein
MRTRRAQYRLDPVRSRTGKGIGSHKLSSQRARAALGRRGPSKGLAVVPELGKGQFCRRERFAPVMKSAAKFELIC